MAMDILRTWPPAFTVLSPLNLFPCSPWSKLLLTLSWPSFNMCWVAITNFALSYSPMIRLWFLFPHLLTVGLLFFTCWPFHQGLRVVRLGSAIGCSSYWVGFSILLCLCLNAFYIAFAACVPAYILTCRCFIFALHSCLYSILREWPLHPASGVSINTTKGELLAHGLPWLSCSAVLFRLWVCPPGMTSHLDCALASDPPSKVLHISQVLVLQLWLG